MGNAAYYMGEDQGHDSNVTFETCWRNLPFAFKFWLIAQFTLLVFQMLFGMGLALAFQPSSPEYIWTFFLSMFWELGGVFGLIDSLFVFLFLLQSFPEMVLHN